MKNFIIIMLVAISFYRVEAHEKAKTLRPFTLQIIEAFKSRNPEKLGKYLSNRVFFGFYEYDEKNLTFKSINPEKEFAKSKLAEILFNREAFNRQWEIAKESFADAYSSNESEIREGYENLNEEYIEHLGKKYPYGSVTLIYRNFRYSIQLFCKKRGEECYIYRFFYSPK